MDIQRTALAKALAESDGPLHTPLRDELERLVAADTRDDETTEQARARIEAELIAEARG